NLNSTMGPVPRGVAGLVDTPAFYPYVSGRQNLALLARLDEQDGARVSARTIDLALEQVGLAARADDKAAGYSAGMRQRLGLAAAPSARRAHQLTRSSWRTRRPRPRAKPGGQRCSRRVEQPRSGRNRGSVHSTDDRSQRASRFFWDDRRAEEARARHGLPAAH